MLDHYYEKDHSHMKIYIHDKRIRWLESYNYLGSKVTSNGKCDEDIEKKLPWQRLHLQKDQYPEEWETLSEN